MKQAYFIIAFLFLFRITGIYAQECRHFHKTDVFMDIAKPYFDDGYIIYNQSKGISFLKGESKKINLVLYGGKDYILLINTSFEKSKLEYSIIDERTRQEIFSHKESIAGKIEFFNESTRKVIIELKHKADRKLNANEVKDGCLGILILWK